MAKDNKRDEKSTEKIKKDVHVQSILTDFYPKKAT